MQYFGILLMVIGLVGVGFMVGQQWERTKQ
jgi:hypothetical protein